MTITLTKAQIAELESSGIKHALVKPSRWNDEAQVSTHQLPVEYLKKLREHASKDSKTWNGVLQKLSILFKVIDAPKKAKVKRLDALAEAIEQAAIVQAEHRLLFDADPDHGVPTPWLVTSVTYSPANTKEDRPAFVRVSLKASAKGETRSSGITFHMDDLTKGEGSTVEDLLLAAGYVFETAELYEDYIKYLADWDVKFKDHFAQYLYKTDELEADDDYGYYRRRKPREGIALMGEYRVVNDVPILKLKGDETTIRIPSLSRGMAEDGSDDDATDVFEIPVHPWIYAFNLETHSHMWVEPHKITKYVYDSDLVNKLILPKSHKDLISLLTTNSDVLIADVVKGKSAATIILCEGEPGLGKSLSAEAFSEAKGKILYRVQSDQLGLTPDDIEKNLKDIFARLVRWDAVLLIDEADIYVRARDVDLEQNAIVGTLLRTFEYASGIIFMTTNRALIVDDAVLSRCSAVLAYDYPTEEHYLQIVGIFTKLFGVEVSKDDAVKFYKEKKGKVSGRFTKNLLRLLFRRGLTKPTYEDIETTASFLR